MNSTNNVPAFLILFIAVIIMTLPFSAMSEGLPYAEAINKADRQRMLTQRITNLYCQIGLDVTPENTYLVKEKLESAKSQWAWFNSSLSLSQMNTFH